MQCRPYRRRQVLLSFRHEETASCSEMVLLPEIDKSAQLPTGETVAAEFVPPDSGEFEFACQMGMIRGKPIVERFFGRCETHNDQTYVVKLKRKR